MSSPHAGMWSESAQWSQALAFRDQLVASMIEAGKLRRDAADPEKQDEVVKRLV